MEHFELHCLVVKLIYIAKAFVTCQESGWEQSSLQVPVGAVRLALFIN